LGRRWPTFGLLRTRFESHDSTTTPISSSSDIIRVGTTNSPCTTGDKVVSHRLGAGFKDHVFRFQILDEAQPCGRDWKDELRDILAAP